MDPDSGYNTRYWRALANECWNSKISPSGGFLRACHVEIFLSCQLSGEAGLSMIAQLSINTIGLVWEAPDWIALRNGQHIVYCTSPAEQGRHRLASTWVGDNTVVELSITLLIDFLHLACPDPAWPSGVLSSHHGAEITPDLSVSQQVVMTPTCPQDHARHDSNGTTSSCYMPIDGLHQQKYNTNKLTFCQPWGWQTLIYFTGDHLF